MTGAALEAFLTVQCIMAIAALGHYLPLSMKQLDVGIAGYMSIGAFVSAILTRDHGWGFGLALLAGAALASAAAFLIDLLATRVKLTGFATAIFSLSFAESLRVVLNNSEAVGGTTGFVGIAPHTTLPLVAIILGVLIAGFFVLDRTRLGQIKTAIGDDEFIVPQFGVNLVRTKLIFYAAGGALGGLAGGLYAHYVLFMRPDDFGFTLLIAIQLPLVFGGLDRFYGALFGIFLLAVVPEMVRGFGQYRLLFTAGATLLLLVVRPSGMLTHETIAILSGGGRRLIGLFSGGKQTSRERP
jgi:branched-chain amino acid transport system permease protein